MANDRLSQQPVEAVVSPTDAEARTSQQSVEAVVLPTTGKARAGQQSVEAVVLPTTAKARTSQLVVETVIENLQSQTIELGLTNQSAATFSPTVTTLATISPALLDQTAVAHEPTIVFTQFIDAGFIDQTAATSAPTIAASYVISADLLDQTAATFSPVVTTAAFVLLALLDQTAAASAPATMVGPQWTTPGDGDPMVLSPELLFIIPAMAGDMHFEIQLDTANTFDTVDFRSVQSGISQIGWAFWDGDSWEPVPLGGVSSSFAGNEARYTVQTPLTETTWYRRVRAGTV